MNNYIVYKHTSPSGKVYIGITKQETHKRWKNGKGYELCTAFYRAIQKYGWENIKHEILESGLSEDEACRKEQEYIKAYNSASHEHGYNLTYGGEHYTPNEEWRAKLSEANKRYYQEHPEARERVSAESKGRKQSDESNRRRSESVKNYYLSHPEKKALCGNSFRGKSRGEEFSRKLGERKSKPVVCIETGETFVSLTHAARRLGVSRTGITNVLRKRSKTCGGYTFEYAEQKIGEEDES